MHQNAQSLTSHYLYPAMPQPLDGLKCLGTVSSIASRAGLSVNNQTSPKRSWLRSWCISQPSQKVSEGMNMMPFCSVLMALLVSLSWTTDGNARPVLPETSDSSFRQDQLSWASDLITISIRLATCPYTSSQRLAIAPFTLPETFGSCEFEFLCPCYLVL